MRHDPFEFHGLTGAERWWRIAFLLALVIVLCLDLFYWRPN
jgi:hypothetical protein